MGGVVTDYRFSFECFDCPFCGKTITPPHVKRHIATHADVSKEDSDIAWVRWLEAREEVAAENADRMVEIIERRRTL
jgi:hypothetical protein